MAIHLIGQKNTKRYEYFNYACETLGAKLEFWDLSSGLASFFENVKAGDSVKIDPPRYETSDLKELNVLVTFYKEQLQRLDQLTEIHFVNSPKAIWNTLDKRYCKKQLEENNISTTPMFGNTFESTNVLKSEMLEQQVYSVFIKPRYGSGAAGVMAYRIAPNLKQEMLQTCLEKKGNEFHNTKRLRKISNINDIDQYINFSLAQDAIVEKWIPKPKIENCVYDLRVVYQYGKIDFMIARGSMNGAITNLHLNNHAIELSALGLSEADHQSIRTTCSDAVSHFNGLNSVGVDLLLSGKMRKPMIIEMNAQGDLLYRDIYSNNEIYRNQVIRMMQNDKNQ
jgi:D-alanine-D-alanine ligase-like ATP-grasp enzyme